MASPEVRRQFSETLSFQEMQKKIREFYGKSLPDPWEKNDRGLSNVGYKIGNDYFLTLHKPGNKDLEAIAKVANAMISSIPIARPVEGQTGYTLEVDTESTLLTPRLPGK